MSNYEHQLSLSRQIPVYGPTFFDGESRGRPVAAYCTDDCWEWIIHLDSFDCMNSAFQCRWSSFRATVAARGARRFTTWASLGPLGCSKCWGNAQGRPTDLSSCQVSCHKTCSCWSCTDHQASLRVRVPSGAIFGQALVGLGLSFAGAAREGLDRCSWCDHLDVYFSQWLMNDSFVHLGQSRLLEGRSHAHFAIASSKIDPPCALMLYGSLWPCSSQSMKTGYPALKPALGRALFRLVG